MLLLIIMIFIYKIILIFIYNFVTHVHKIFTLIYFFINIHTNLIHINVFNINNINNIDENNNLFLC